MKWLLLSFILLIGILGKTREYFNEFSWQCPSILGECPEGCAPQETDEYNCTKALQYTGPKECSRSCPYVCKDPKKCKIDSCCKNCPKTMIKAECGIFS